MEKILNKPIGYIKLPEIRFRVTGLNSFTVRHVGVTGRTEGQTVSVCSTLV